MINIIVIQVVGNIEYSSRFHLISPDTGSILSLKLPKHLATSFRNWKHGKWDPLLGREFLVILTW
jgi:hypothetical protein